MAEEKETVKDEEEEDEKEYIVLTDENGKDTKVELLFSIRYPKNSFRYIYVNDPEDKEAVLVFKGDDDDEEGNLVMVSEDNTDEEEMKFIQNAFDAFQKNELEPVKDEDDDEEEQHHHEGECCEGEECHCHHHHHHEGEGCEGEERHCHHHHEEDSSDNK